MVANPANTNALILKEFAPSIPEKNISCLTRLDHNRGLGQIAERLNVPVSTVKNVIIWGNHSSSQYPDVNHAVVGGKPVREAVADDAWYTFLTLDKLIWVLYITRDVILKCELAFGTIICFLSHLFSVSYLAVVLSVCSGVRAE